VALVPWLGLYVSSLLLIAVFMKWLGRYGWALVAALAVGVPVAAYVMFEKWFLVPLPKGPIEDLLGL
jgi:putative tricarboxylic transport membrane protein